MKKLGLIALVAMFAGATALAGTAIIPLFVDSAGVSLSTGIPTAPGSASWIQVLNKSGGTVTCTVAYMLTTGAAAGPATNNNTFALVAGQSVAWRPGEDDPTNEAPMPGAGLAMIAPAYQEVGSCAIVWSGGTIGDIVVSLKTVDSAGMMAMYGPFLGF